MAVEQGFLALVAYMGLLSPGHRESTLNIFSMNADDFADASLLRETTWPIACIEKKL